MGSSLSSTKKKAAVEKQAAEDPDKSFDRKALVDKITQKVEFIFLPSYQNMRRMILKGVRMIPKK